MTTWVISASVTGAIGLTARPALLDSSLRWAATGILGGLFQTPRR